MCGRTACTLCSDSIIKANAFKPRDSKKLMSPEWYENKAQPYKPSYNQSPAQCLAVMVLKKQIDKTCLDCDQRLITGMRFGLIPNWHKADANQFKLKTINCRVETIKEKPTYNVPLERGKRCVILVEGFFEWKRNEENNAKEPYFFYFPQKYVDFKNREEWMENESELYCNSEWKGPRLLTIAGLFTSRKCDQSDDQMFSFTIITVPSHSKLRWIHDRMPAILDSADDVRDWLDFENVNVDKALELLVPFDGLEWHRVSNAVGNTRNDTIENILPVKETKKQKTIDQWFKSKSTSKISPKKSSPEESSSKSSIKFKKEVKEEDDEEIEPKKKRKQTQ